MLRLGLRWRRRLGCHRPRHIRRAFQLVNTAEIDWRQVEIADVRLKLISDLRFATDQPHGAPSLKLPAFLVFSLLLDLASGAALATVSLRKYKHMVDAWGGWELFQELLGVLKAIAEKHGVGIANVATRAILDRPTVAGVIVGVRLGIAEHRAENARVFDCALDDEDREHIQAVLAKSRDLYRHIGDCGDEYRR